VDCCAKVDRNIGKHDRDRRLIWITAHNALKTNEKKLFHARRFLLLSAGNPLIIPITGRKGATP
jgi:hypothetical protein